MPLLTRLRQLLLPAPADWKLDARERWRASGGAALGVWLAGALGLWCSRWLGLSPWLVAPVAASAVIVFVLPASPLAQPWPVLGGSTLAALIAVAVVRLVPGPLLASGLAVGLSVAAMLWTRSLHPPAGAVALLVVLNQVHDPVFALFPVLGNALVLVLAAALYNSATGKPYPHRASPPPDAARPPRFTGADLDAALAHYNQALDVNRQDLAQLLHYAESAAYQRKLGELRCADIMSSPPLAVSYDTPLPEAWALMRGRAIKALPVVDRSQQLVGIVSLSDFVRHALPQWPDPQAGATAPAPADPAGRIAQIMTRRVRVASTRLHVIELLPLFSEGGHHHLPVVNDQQQLVGILTQSDLIRALDKAVKPG